MSGKDDPNDRIVVIREEFVRGRIFATRKLLSYDYEEYPGRSELDDGSKDPEGHFSEGLELARRIFDIEGVESVSIDQYKVYVIIGHAFDWTLDNIEAKVIMTIRKYIGMCRMMEKISNKKFKKNPDSDKGK